MHIDVTPRVVETKKVGKLTLNLKATTFSVKDDDGTPLLEAKMPLVRNMDHTSLKITRSSLGTPCDEILMYLGNIGHDNKGGISKSPCTTPHVTYIAHHRSVSDPDGHPYTVLGSALLPTNGTLVSSRDDHAFVDRIRSIHDYAVAHALTPAHEAIMLAAADATCREMDRHQYPIGKDTPFSKSLKIMGVTMTTRTPEERTADPWPRDPDKNSLVLRDGYGDEQPRRR